jgi:hypothetical protein
MQTRTMKKKKPSSPNKIGLRKWEVLQTWDQNALLTSVINAEKLRVATGKMEPSWRNQGLSNGQLQGAQQRQLAYGISPMPISVIPAKLKYTVTLVRSMANVNVAKSISVFAQFYERLTKIKWGRTQANSLPSG